ncbi:putative gamma-glutamylcyclotransferase At3g02910 [Ziziphus jujuba]|uniref:Gamma-glutamylcyclotransferase family protein n=1 Tax=Ziziphus jujuba TaxID=326968 RepID=A0A6P4BD30_ZIZJJ|nr:putative gamma-glutamylcyclotransferase At3g02910 [Ziziphus jujuba]
MADNSKDETKHSLIFTYGSLKRGFKNHFLMEDLITQNDAVLIGSFVTQDPYPLVIGPYTIGYLINLPGNGHRVKGELYSVSAPGLARLDELEATRLGHYERLPIEVVSYRTESDDKEQDNEDVVEAEAYYAHRSFGEALWNKKMIQCVSEYSERENSLFVKKKDRLNGGRNFLDELRDFISASSDTHETESEAKFGENPTPSSGSVGWNKIPDSWCEDPFRK